MSVVSGQGAAKKLWYPCNLSNVRRKEGKGRQECIAAATRHAMLHGQSAEPRCPVLRLLRVLQAKGKTSDAITKLCQLAPPSALLVEVDGKGGIVREEEVPTALVHRGDLLKVRVLI